MAERRFAGRQRRYLQLQHHQLAVAAHQVRQTDGQRTVAARSVVPDLADAYRVAAFDRQPHVLGDHRQQVLQFAAEDRRDVVWRVDEIVVAAALFGQGGQQVLVKIVAHAEGRHRHAAFAHTGDFFAQLLRFDDAFVSQPVGQQQHPVDLAVL